MDKALDWLGKLVTAPRRNFTYSRLALCNLTFPPMMTLSEESPPSLIRFMQNKMRVLMASNQTFLLHIPAVSSIRDLDSSV